MDTTDDGAQYTNTIQDGSNDRKYFVQTPQIVWAKCDSPHEYMLWNVVKMIAAEKGECYVTTPGLARMCMMGTGTVSRARKALLDKGLLRGRLVDHGHGKAWHLSIPDLWAENVKWRKEHQALTIRMGLKPARTKDQRDEPSPLEGLPSPLERKKNPSEEEPSLIPAQAQNETPVSTSPVPAAVPSEQELEQEYIDTIEIALGLAKVAGIDFVPRSEPDDNKAWGAELLDQSKRLNAHPPPRISAEQRIADTRAASARWYGKQVSDAGGYRDPDHPFEKAIKRYGDDVPALRRFQTLMEMQFALAPDWGNKQQVKSWATGVHELWVACGGDDHIMNVAYKRLSDSGMTIASPRSLVKTARAIAAERATAYVAPSARAVKEYV